MNMEGPMIKVLFELAEKFYKGDISFTEANNSLKDKGLDTNLIKDYLIIYPCLLNGKTYTNWICGDAMRYYLDQIFQTKGMPYLRNALQALSLHIDCNEDAPEEVTATNKGILYEYLSSFGFLCDEYFEDTIPDSATMKDGLTKYTIVNLYERNPIIRSRCIEYFGATCQVCDLNFETKYGPLGKGFIHVHHVVDISAVHEEYVVDVIHDLQPVCPNCHSMLHKRKPAYLVQELRDLMNKGLESASYAKHWGYSG